MQNWEMTKATESGHIVAVFGAAVAGSEAASKLNERNIRTVVFEQNALPYGKIESGLPKWHVKLRDREESRIDEKLGHPLVQFVPGVKLGVDLSFPDLLNNWGFSAVLLATGAWQDRPLPLKNIDRFINRGLYYQNPLVAWFNTNHDPRFVNEAVSLVDDAIIIGGGLASIDVAKIMMIETVRLALAERGKTSDVLFLEKMGVSETLGQLGLTMADLGLKGCTLYYRRRLTDMPLSTLPENPTAHEVEVAHRVRHKIIENVRSKFPFRFQECRQPVDLVVKDDHLQGLVFQKNDIRNGRLVTIPGSEYTVHSPLVISAIGSVPEPIRDVPYLNQSFEIDDVQTGRLRGYENVFALGNAVTGRGNIKESQLHGRRVSEQVIDEFLAWQENDYEEIFERAVDNADRKVGMISVQLQKRARLAADKINAIIEKADYLQNKSGYNGDYQAWIKKHLPVRLFESPHSPAD
jgi:NADPH-dependent glutamate synthase beta subunit-like oxidoreductase